MRFSRHCYAAPYGACETKLRRIAYTMLDTFSCTDHHGKGKKKLLRWDICERHNNVLEILLREMNGLSDTKSLFLKIRRLKASP